LAYPAERFLHIDPLLMVTTALSAHDVAAGFAWAVVLAVLTLVLGRFFCSWICPMGTLCHVTGAAAKKVRGGKPKPEVSTGAQKLKYYVLIFLVVTSIHSLQLVGIMDPIALTTRSFTTAVFPVIDLTIRAVIDFIASFGIPPLNDLLGALDESLQQGVLLQPAPSYGQAFFLGLLFVVIVGASVYRHRFWCRVLCPLGALLGVLSRVSILNVRRDSECTECGACGFNCPSAADPHVKGGWKKHECYLCWNCASECPTDQVAIGRRKSDAGPTEGSRFQWERRHFLTSAIGGLAFAPLLRIGFRPERPDPGLIRPPGSTPEAEFLARCVRCGACMKVCPTNALHPTLFEAGLEGLWTPTLVPRIGYCDYSCTLCGQTCPSDAIKELSLPVKQETKIGLAVIERGRCLPWAMDNPCIVCEEHCPIPTKAIYLREETVRKRDGTLVTLKRPYVDADLCTGCGICEHVCPMGEAAIRVIPPGSG
ncbi:MAG: 4Fe-4S dicluster domain-containing protein, partial [Planctomycetota bacterium]